MGNILTDIVTNCNKSYSYSRFQEKGVELQNGAQNWWEAKRLYNNSCMLCCMTNRPGASDCFACPIREAMLSNAQIFWKKMPKQEYEWVEKERRLL